jgi:uncharacterized protein
MVKKHLIEVIRAQFRLDWHGIHGANHWSRVRENGVRLAATTGANIAVVELFAFLHDSQRANDFTDPSHGQRAAVFAGELRELGVIEISDLDFDLLSFACAGHSNGFRDGDVTVQTCWDADRLDLGRVGIRPHPRYLCTDAAKSPGMIDWAYTRSLKRL